MQGTDMRRTPLGWLGVLVGFAGAALDFYSGYLLLAQSPGSGEMGVLESNWAALIWGVGVGALGVVLAVTSAALVFGSGQRRMKDFGALMIVYGLAMLFIGGAMYSGVASQMVGNVVPGIGMLAVGVLMVANGALMLRPELPTP
jgi:hypothetical protein